MIKKLNLLYESVYSNDLDYDSFQKRMVKLGYLKFEDYKKDKHYRKLASNLIDTLIHDYDKLEHQQLLMINKTPVKGVMIALDQINPEIKLDLMFIYNDEVIPEGFASFSLDYSRPYIMVGMGKLPENYSREDLEYEVGTLLFMDENNIHKKLFHEIIHYFDYQRTNNKEHFLNQGLLKPPSDTDEIKDYINNEYEYNAWVQGFLNKLDKQFEKEPNKRMLIGKNFQSFLNRLKTIVIRIPDESYSALNHILNSKFKKKFHKRLYQYWIEKKKELFR